MTMTAGTSIQYMLDTNAVSDFIKGWGQVRAKAMTLPTSALFISAITEAELHYGLAKKPEAKTLHHLVHEFLSRVEVLPWDTECATKYGTLRANLQSKGTPLGSLDMLIAAHALTYGMVLVTKDKAFELVEALQTENWF